MKNQFATDHKTIEMIQKARAGDEKAIGYLLEQYHEQMMLFARGHVACDEDAKAAVENAAKKIILDRANLSDTDDFISWMFLTVRNEAINLSLESHRKRELERPHYQLNGTAKEKRELNEDEKWEQIKETLRYLSEEQLDYMRMRYIEGLTIEKIAEKKSMPLSDARKYARQIEKQIYESIYKKKGDDFEYDEFR